jgi:putative endopeptidase
VKTRLLAIPLAMMAGCGSNKPAATAPPAPAPEVASATPASSPTPAPAPASDPAPEPSNRPRPEIGKWGFDLAGMDPSVAPGASFYRYANGKWLTNTQIPADKADYGMFTMLADRSEERTRQIIESASGAPGSDGQRIADYYKAFMDEAAIEARGIKPIQPEIDRIAKIKDTSGVAMEFAVSARRLGGRGALNATPFQTVVGQDAREPDRYIGHISQGGLGLPDRDMYDAHKEQFAKVRDGYQKYIATIFTLIGAKDADKRAAGVYGLEEKIAQTHWTRVQNRDANKRYNKMTVDELVKLAPGMAWKPWLHAVGLDGQTQVIVGQPSAITGEAQLVKSEPLAVWKDYLTFHAVSAAAPFLPRKFVDAHFEMYEKTLRGTPQLKERWKRAVDLITGGMGEAVGQIYVAKYFTPETKASADALVKNLRAAMGQRLDGLAWMGAETRSKAKAKLATYNPKIGYPVVWRDYSALAIKPGDAVGNAKRTGEFEYNRRLARLGKPIDRNEWNMTPMTINAYYNPELNEIVFPAAILQPPFFDPSADDAVNYGGIGAVIGHEISHGFDDQGSKFDATGKLENWWTKDDADKFKTATAKLVAQYNAYCPFPAANGKPAQCVKGELTLGENIGDLAGLTIAYTAYKLSLGGKTPPVLDGFTGDQRFFLGWAQVWRRLVRDEEAANRLTTDPHSPSEYRTSVVRNLDAWYDAFKPQPGDALYLTPDQRVRIW